jgi:hypothetical protein
MVGMNDFLKVPVAMAIRAALLVGRRTSYFKIQSALDMK